ncbi:MAG: hypothetical protein H6747_10175 [Deltaproteobacteria bacterium]|nr:hypothetical protein [Deltaproteobacteria bacterium]
MNDVKRFHALRGKALAFGLVGAMALGAAGCGTTAEAQMSRFKDNKVKVEALVAKRPDLKDSIAKQSADFQREYDEILAAGGDPKEQLIQLNRRMRTYLETVDPSQKLRATASSKLNRANNAPPPGTAAPRPGAPMNAGMAPGGKLGGAQPGAPGTAPGAIAPPPPGAAPTGKLGGAPAVAPGAVPPPPPGAIPPPPPGAAPTGKLGGAPGTAPGAMPAGGGVAPTGKLGGTP